MSGQLVAAPATMKPELVGDACDPSSLPDPWSTDPAALPADGKVG